MNGRFLIPSLEQADDSSLGGAFTTHIFTDRGHRQGRHSGHRCSRLKSGSSFWPWARLSL
ncbi:unnamed protein product [Prunus armeniaca]